MSTVEILLLVVLVASALLLVLLVLIQNENSEGLGGIFGGGGASAQIGNRSGSILTRITSVLGALFLFCSFGLAWLNRTPGEDNVEAAARRLESQDAIEWWNVDDQPVSPEQPQSPEQVDESLDLLAPDLIEGTFDPAESNDESEVQ